MGGGVASATVAFDINAAAVKIKIFFIGFSFENLILIQDNGSSINQKLE